MPRPDPQKHAAGRDAVDRGDGMGGDRRDARTGNRHARAEPDPRRILCGQGKRGVAVRPDHLRVGHPRRVESQVFDVFEDVPVVDFGMRGNAELHGVPPSGCVRRPDVSSAAGGDKSGHGWGMYPATSRRREPSRTNGNGAPFYPLSFWERVRERAPRRIASVRDSQAEDANLTSSGLTRSDRGSRLEYVCTSSPTFGSCSPAA